MADTAILETLRLILVASPKEWIQLSLSDPNRLAELLDAHLPIDWPTEELRRGVRYVLEEMTGDTQEMGWWIWWVLEKISANEGTTPRLVGNIGFKGAPKRSGIVELSYSLVPTAMGRGLTTEGVGALVPWSLKDPRVKRVVATTHLENLESQKVLRKNGFALVQDESDQNELCFEFVPG